MRMRNQRTYAPLVPLLLAALVGSAGGTAAAENIDPAGDDHQYAWGEDIGWVNAEPSGDGGPGAEVGDFQLTGWMWSENSGWISLSCANTASCGLAQYGVANDGFGGLSGFAWGENIGWINFNPTGCEPDPTCGVTIDPATGYFGGRAWGENVGWISFSSGSPDSWTARTSWCQATAAPPGAGPALSFAKSGQETSLNWPALGAASWYDAVAGKLSTLRASGGDFSTSTDRCLGARLAATSLLVPGSPPSAGDGFWFLVRGANCRGRGTFDSGSPSQVGSRDAEIAASPNHCP